MAALPERLRGPAVLCWLEGRIQQDAARLLRPGGRLVYATCSLLPEENEAQIASFLERNPSFSVVPANDGGDFITLTPRRHGTDGFFAAILESAS